jgi:lantibiotic modifying enzyme
MGRMAPRNLALPVLLAALSTAHATDYMEAAQGIGRYLLKSARREGDAVYWAQYEGSGPGANGEELHFPLSLYSGIAGTGHFLLNLHLATGDKKYLQAARGVGVRLIELAAPAPSGGTRWEATYERKGRAAPDGTRLGLYTGNAGIGTFLIHLHRVTKETRFLDAAEAAFQRILAEMRPEGHWVYASKDIIGGEAGIGLALLELHRITGKARYRAAAKKAASWLIGTSEQEGDHVRWKGFKPYDAGYSHGAAGMAFFLETVGETKPSRAAANWVASVAKPCGEGAVLWEYYPGEPPKGKRNWVMNSWCHGAPGVVKLFVLLHARTGERRYLQIAERGGGGICHEAKIDSGSPSYYNPTYCCGAAGCLDTLSDLYRTSGKRRWFDRARALADSMVRSLVEVDGERVHAQYDESDRKIRKHPYVGTGFMHGNAGVGFALLRIAMQQKGEEQELLHLPDSPFSLAGSR